MGVNKSLRFQLLMLTCFVSLRDVADFSSRVNMLNVAKELQIVKNLLLIATGLQGVVESLIVADLGLRLLILIHRCSCFEILAKLCFLLCFFMGCFCWLI
ncbi:hypothetical protein Droror1_Dr00017493 [Drosera rotundifolia]